MSEENVGIVRWGYEAWNRRDFDQLLEFADPESSRSTSATGSPPPASAPAQCSPGEPPPITMTS